MLLSYDCANPTAPRGIVFRAYADLLEAKLPTSQTASGQQYRLLDGGELTVCYVVNTAEYCADILPQLEEMIKCVMHLSYAPHRVLVRS